MIRMLLLTVLFFFGPALLMFAAHRATMILRLWWRGRQYRQQQDEGVIDITPTNDTSMRPGGVFIAASIMVATACAFIAWQSTQQQPTTQKNHYTPAHLDRNGQLLASQTHPLPSKSTASLEFSDGILRLPPPVSSSAAVYVNIYNSKDETITIIGINSAIAKTAMMHGMNKNNGMMHMVDMKQLSIPAHTTVRFSVGQQHIMLMGLKRNIKQGEKVSIELVLEHGEKQSFLATVTDLR